MTGPGAVVLASRLEQWPLPRLVPYERNARTHSVAQIDKLAALIVEFGFTSPILVDEASGILAGHGRLAAAKKLGLEAVPVVQLTHLSAAQKRAYILADNRIALDAGWDEELLAGEMAFLNSAGYDLAMTGFNDAELADLLVEREPGPEDSAPAAPVVAVCRPGDLWLLGDHRLVCGDALEPASFAALMGQERAHCVWTDPPYNVDYVGKTADALTIKNDEMSDEDFGVFLGRALRNTFTVMNPGAAIYMAFAETKGLVFRAAFAGAGFYQSSCLIWRKNVMVLGHSDYQWRHEPILYGWRGDGSHRFYGGRDKTTMFELGDPLFAQIADDQWQITLGEETLVIRGSDLTVQRVAGSIFFEEKPPASAAHPTMKPVALIERMLSNSSRRGDVVLDAFGGSGSTLIACEKLKRRAHLLELDPKYCDVIVRRWQDYAGGVATLGGKPFAAIAAERS